MVARTVKDAVDLWADPRRMLPLTLAEITETAADSLKACAGLRYVFDADAEGFIQGKRRVRLSPSGAIMACHMGVNPRLTYQPGDFVERIARPLRAVDFLGRAHLFEAVFALHGLDRLSEDKVREIQWHQINLYSPAQNFLEAERAQRAYAHLFDSLGL